MRSTFSLLFYINRAKVKADGPPVLCRITIDGRNTVLTTDIACRPEDWIPSMTSNLPPERQLEVLQMFLQIPQLLDLQQLLLLLGLEHTAEVYLQLNWESQSGCLHIWA